MPKKSSKSTTTRLMGTVDLSSYAATGETQDLNFKVAPDFHRKFKAQAALRRLSMREMLEAAANEYWQRHEV